MTVAKTKPAPSPEQALAAPPANLVELKIATPEGDAAHEAMNAITYAMHFTVANASDSAKGQEARARLNSKIKSLTEARLALTRPIDAAKKVIVDFFAGPIAKFTEARDQIDAKVISYQDEQEELRRAEQRRLDKIAEDERKRLQAIADEARRKAEAEAEQLRKDAEAAAAAGRAEEAAKLATKAGRVEERADAKATVFEDRAAATVAPVAQAETAVVAGTGFREIPEWEVIDATKINAPFMTPDATKIGKIVTSLKLEAVGVVGPGLKVTMKKILASRRT